MISATLSIRKCKYYVLFKVFESLACREVGGKFKIMTRQFFPFRTQGGKNLHLVVPTVKKDFPATFKKIGSFCLSQKSVPPRSSNKTEKASDKHRLEKKEVVLFYIGSLIKRAFK